MAMCVTFPIKHIAQYLIINIVQKRILRNYHSIISLCEVANGVPPSKDTYKSLFEDANVFKANKGNFPDCVRI